MRGARLTGLALLACLLLCPAAGVAEPGRIDQSTFWDSYSWYVVGIISMCLLQAALICGLLIQRARYGRMQSELRESERAVRDSNSRIRDLAGRLITAQEEERKHIARELHDDLNQQVAVLAIRLGTFKRRFLTDAATLEEISGFQTAVIGMSEHIRRLSHELHSSVLQHVGAAVALRAYCQEFTERQGIVVAVDIQEEFEPVPMDLSLCLYRVLQESLRNVAKHAGVQEAEVRLAAADGVLELQVRDRGAGFDPKAAESRNGLGLLSMEERVRLLQGTFELKSRAGGGTEVRVRMPLPVKDSSESAEGSIVLT
jgi:two-component system sensor histidine kinase UhpB